MPGGDKERQIAGWKLPAEERRKLLASFEPRYGRIVADHVTLRFGTNGDTPLPTETEGEVIGENAPIPIRLEPGRWSH